MGEHALEAPWFVLRRTETPLYRAVARRPGATRARRARPYSTCGNLDTALDAPFHQPPGRGSLRAECDAGALPPTIVEHPDSGAKSISYWIRCRAAGRNWRDVWRHRRCIRHPGLQFGWEDHETGRRPSQRSLTI